MAQRYEPQDGEVLSTFESTSRRQFLKQVGAVIPASAFVTTDVAAQALGKTTTVIKSRTAPASPPKGGFIAIQLGARAFVDEGVDRVLDTLVEKAGVNVIMPAVYTYGEGMAGRQMKGQPPTDHGVQEYAEVVGGAYTRQHSEFYGNSVIKNVRAPELGDFDILADVIPKAKARGIKTYALFEEKYNPRLMQNFPRIAEVDVYGRLGTDPCFNNPYARAFLLALVEDWFKSNDLDGVMWESERQGPLNTTIGAHFAKTLASPRRSLSCFCEHCERKLRERGVDFNRVKEGFLALERWVGQVRGKPRSADGSFVTLWRLLAEYPELLTYERFWFMSQEEMYGLIYGTVKSINPKAQVGWHIMHLVTMSPFYSADQNYARLAHIADFLKPSPYNNCGGGRLAQYVQNVSQTVFRDFQPEEVLQMHYKLMGYENEAPLSKLPQVGLSADYVSRETRRALDDVKGLVPIYPGIDIDIPVNPGEKRTTPEGVKAATAAALNVGAQGVVLSRNYAEMRLTNLAGAGEAVKNLRRDDYYFSVFGLSQQHERTCMNRLHRAIESAGGKPILGAALYSYNPIFLEIAARIGFKAIWIEMEHAPITFAEAADLCRMASGTGMLTMIRIPDSRRENVLKAAECGPDILDIPMADSADQITELVRYARFAPLGSRGYFSVSRALHYGLVDSVSDEQQKLNEELSLLAQIETVQALDRIEALAAIPGVDLFIGPADLAASLGCPGQTNHPLVLDAAERIVATARRHGKKIVTACAASEYVHWTRLGVDLLFCTNDIVCMKAGAQSAMNSAHEAISKTEEEIRLIGAAV